MTTVWSISNFPILFMKCEDGEEFQQQCGCVACQQAYFKGHILEIFDDVWKEDLLRFDCNTTAKLVKSFLEKYVPTLSDIQVNYITEAYVEGVAIQYNRQFNFVFTWENCD